MLRALLLAALLLAAPAARAAELKLTNVRSTYGELGGPRPDGKLFPGDILFLGFDIENIAIAPDGKVNYTMAMEVVDKANKPVFKQEPATKTEYVPLGGTKLPARAFITIGLDQEPGAYTLKMTVTDNATKASQTLAKGFEVEKLQFAIVQVLPCLDQKGELPAPTVGVVGQQVFVFLGAVGFGRAPVDAKDPKKGSQPNLTFEMLPLDERGQPTITKPAVYELTGGVKEEDQGVTARFQLPYTRAGKYTVRLKATDNVTKKSATYELPLTVVAPEGK